MERLIRANLYKLIKRRETYFLLILICVESAVSASIPKTGYAMFIERCNIPIALDLALAFLAVIIFAEENASRYFGIQTIKPFSTVLIGLYHIKYRKN
jgi:hypothetical protein